MPLKEELTEKMHGEFTVDAETDRAHTILVALAVIADGTLTRERALQAYGLTDEELKAVESA